MNRRVRTILITICIIAGIVTVSLLRPWRYLHLLPVIESGTALTVNTVLGKAEIYLDGKKVGESPYTSENLSAGDHDIEVRRVSETEDFYVPLKKSIHLESNTRTFLEVELGPDEQFSSYKLVYYRKGNADEASTFVTTTPKGSTVTVDEEKMGETPFSTAELTAGRHTLTVDKAGYESSEVSIIVRDGYTLIGEIQLMAEPVELTEN